MYTTRNKELICIICWNNGENEARSRKRGRDQASKRRRGNGEKNGFFSWHRVWKKDYPIQDHARIRFSLILFYLSKWLPTWEWRIRNLLFFLFENDFLFSFYFVNFQCDIFEKENFHISLFWRLGIPFDASISYPWTTRNEVLRAYKTMRSSYFSCVLAWRPKELWKSVAYKTAGPSCFLLLDALIRDALPSLAHT